jgi:hypothetical protein
MWTWVLVSLLAAQYAFQQPKTLEKQITKRDRWPTKNTKAELAIAGQKTTLTYWRGRLYTPSPAAPCQISVIHSIHQHHHSYFVKTDSSSSSSSIQQSSTQEKKKEIYLFPVHRHTCWHLWSHDGAASDSGDDERERQATMTEEGLRLESHERERKRARERELRWRTCAQRIGWELWELPSVVWLSEKTGHANWALVFLVVNFPVFFFKEVPNIGPFRFEVLYQG